MMTCHTGHPRAQSRVSLIRGARRVLVKGRQSGVALIEALVSILIFSLGILALIGMQTVAIQHASEANYRGEATFLANQAIGAMWSEFGALGDFATPSGTKSAGWRSRVAERLPNGTGAITIVGDSVTVVVGWTSPGGTPHNHTVKTRIRNS